MVDAKRAAKKAAAETDNIPQEQTVDLGEMPMDQSPRLLYGRHAYSTARAGNGRWIEDDIAPIEAVREAVKLDGIEQQRAKNALNRPVQISKRLSRSSLRKRLQTSQIRRPNLRYIYANVDRRKAAELRQQDVSGEKKQIEGDDDFVAESMSTARIAGILRKSRLGDPEMDSKSGEGKIKLEPIFENQMAREASLESDSVMGPFIEELASVHLDLLDRGMPRQHIEGIRGTYALEGDIDLFDDAVAAYFPQNEAIAKKPRYLRRRFKTKK